MAGKSPKEAAIEVEAMLKEAGYMLGDLSFGEMVGGRFAHYDFGRREYIDVSDVTGNRHFMPTE